MLVVYLTVTSIGVCDGGECSTLFQTIEHVSADIVRVVKAPMANLSHSFLLSQTVRGKIPNRAF